MKVSTRVLVGAAVTLLVPLSLLAADKRIVEKRDPDKEPRTDTQYLAKAIEAEVAEVKFGETAVKKAEHKDVRAFAQTMIDDHTKQRDALLKQAKTMKLAVVEGLEKGGREEMVKLSRLKNTAFDREYMDFMVDSHERALKLYEGFSKNAKDSDLRDLATKAVPKVKEHLRKARELHARLKARS